VARRASRRRASWRSRRSGDFDFAFARSLKRETVLHLHQRDFLAEKQNVIFLGPPGTGETHLSLALGVQAARRGHRVAFASAQQ